MRKNIFLAVALSLMTGTYLPAQGTPAFPDLGSGAVGRFSEAETGFVGSWIRREVPDCPAAAVSAATQGFLEELRRRYPDQADRLLAPDFAVPEHRSMLLRQVAVHLPASAPAGLREKVAQQRLACLTAGGKVAGVDLTESAGLLAKIKEGSAVQHRRVLEGRLDDDELRLLLERTRQPVAERKAVVAAKPAELTAADIVAEFSRRNQTGAAVARWQAYTIEGRLTDASGAVTELLLFKMRPDRFRLVLRQEGRTRSLLAGDGEQYWMQVPGQPARLIPAAAMAERRHLGEFIDPLLVGEGYAFERLADGADAGKPFHRIAVRRPDGSGFVARIDRETFHEIGRENPDKSVVTYRDHREVAGVTLAFEEVAVGATGGSSTFVITRVTPNPGLIRDLFQPPLANQPTYLDFESAASSAKTAALPLSAP